MNAKRKTAPKPLPKTADEIRAAETERRRKLQIDLRRHLENEIEGATRRMDGNATGMYLALLDGDYMAAQAWGLAALHELYRRVEANR